MASELNVGGITTTGNVGVGTSPTAISNYTALTISGAYGGVIDLKNGSTEDLRLLSQSTQSFVGTQSATPLILRTAGAEAMRIASTGLATFSAGINVNSTGNFSKIETAGWVTVADDSTITLSTSSVAAALISVHEIYSGEGGVFFVTFTGAAILIASDGNVAATDSDTNMCVYKSPNSHTVTFKNRTGVTRNFNIAQLGGTLT
jgi:hypothetical protein